MCAGLVRGMRQSPAHFVVLEDAVTTQKTTSEDPKLEVADSFEAGIAIGPLEDTEEDEAETQAPVAESVEPERDATVEPSAALSTAPAAEKAPVPAEKEPPASDAELQAAQRRIVELESKQASEHQQALFRKNEAEDDALLAAYAGGLEGRSIEPAVVQELVAERRANLQGHRALEYRTHQLEAAYSNLTGQMESKVEMVVALHGLTGMPLRDLMNFNDPEKMHLSALLYKKDKEAETQKRSQVKPLKLASTAPSGARPTSYDALRDRMLAGESLERMTLAEKKALFPDRY